MSVEQELCIGNLQGRGLESHLTEIIWLEPKPERIAGIWIDPNWLADNAEDGKQHTNAGWHAGAREAPRETVVAQLLAFSLPICARDDGVEVLTGEPFRDIQAYLERFIAALAALNQNEARRGATLGSLVRSTWLPLTVHVPAASSSSAPYDKA